MDAESLKTFAGHISNFWQMHGLQALLGLLMTPALFLLFEKLSRPDNSRLAINLEILKRLKKYAKENPDQRFGQILRNLGAVKEIGVRDSSQEEYETPDYYWERGVFEESIATLVRMEKIKRGNYEDTKIITKTKK